MNFMGIFQEKLQADPGFPVTVVSTIINFTLSSLFFCGVTGNPRAGMFAGLLSIPFCLITNILDTERDYQLWKEMEGMRARGIPEILFPKKVKYDWSYYEPLRKEIEQYYNRDMENKQEAS
uniref:PrgI family protein n=1 Tax=Elaeophora elaphi TaxID=1147741 RepID=A0A0R3S2P9_9BILA